MKTSATSARLEMSRNGPESEDEHEEGMPDEIAENGKPNTLGTPGWPSKH